MYEALRRIGPDRLQSFGVNDSAAVVNFVADHGQLPAVVYTPDGRVAVRLIDGELPAEATLEPVRESA